jgi:hypothetical protein
MFFVDQPSTSETSRSAMTSTPGHSRALDLKKKQTRLIQELVSFQRSVFSAVSQEHILANQPCVMFEIIKILLKPPINL